MAQVHLQRTKKEYTLFCQAIAAKYPNAIKIRMAQDNLNTHAPNPKALTPPRKNARIWQHANTKAERLKRDENLRYLRKHGRKTWKNDSGYHVRSLAETAMFRMKTIFGDELSARLMETQTSQALIRCAALNTMTRLGMPQSYKVS